MIKLPGRGHRGKGVPGVCGLFCIFLSLSSTPTPLFSPPLPSPLKQTGNNTGKAGFLFNFLYPWWCPKRERYCTIDSTCLLVLFCPQASTLLPLVRSKSFKGRPVGYLVMSSVLLGQFWQPHLFPVHLPKSVCFLSLVREAGRKDRRASQWWIQGRCREGCDVKRPNLVSLHFPKHGNFGGGGLDHLEITPRQHFEGHLYSLYYFVTARMAQGPPSCCLAFLAFRLQLPYFLPCFSPNRWGSRLQCTLWEMPKFLPGDVWSLDFQDRFQ